MLVSELSVHKEHPERKILLNALRQYTAGELVNEQVFRTTEEEFNDTIYRWVVIYALDDFRKVVTPLPPKGYNEYMSFPYKRRQKIIREDEIIRAMVISYRSKVIMTEYKNRDNQYWLSRMIEYFRGKNEMEKVKQIEEIEESYL